MGRCETPKTAETYPKALPLENEREIHGVHYIDDVMPWQSIADAVFTLTKLRSHRGQKELACVIVDTKKCIIGC